MQQADLRARQQGLSKRLILGFTALASAAVIGAAGLVGAAPNNKPPSMAECDPSFKNHGQCVKDWAKNKKTGYGGAGSGNVNANIETNIDAEVNGDNNVIEIVINFFFGE